MKRTPTEFELAAARRAVARITPLVAQLSPDDQARVHDLASALVVATEEEVGILINLMETAVPYDLEHVAAVARGVIVRHLEEVN